VEQFRADSVVVVHGRRRVVLLRLLERHEERIGLPRLREEHPLAEAVRQAIEAGVVQRDDNLFTGVVRMGLKKGASERALQPVRDVPDGAESDRNQLAELPTGCCLQAQRFKGSYEVAVVAAVGPQAEHEHARVSLVLSIKIAVVGSVVAQEPQISASPIHVVDVCQCATTADEIRVQGTHPGNGETGVLAEPRPVPVVLQDVCELEVRLFEESGERDVALTLCELFELADEGLPRWIQLALDVLEHGLLALTVEHDLGARRQERKAVLDLPAESCA
jgi:hypothetical protein